MDLLKIVDILLGVSVVMLIMSLVVTALTEMVMGLINQKGRTLRDGLVNLLVQIDTSLSRERARELASDLLVHPLVADAGNRMGHVIQRHELAELLLQMATGESWQPAPRSRWRRVLAFLGFSPSSTAQAAGPHPLADEVRRILAASDQRLPAEQARAVLRNVRASAINLMQSDPDMKESQRRDQALLAEFKGDFIDKLFTHFDAAIERTQARFAYPVRVYTIIGATVLAFATQLDTLHLVNKLSVDTEFREELVRTALEMGKTGRPGEPTTSPPPKASEPSAKSTTPEPARKSESSKEPDVTAATPPATAPALKPLDDAQKRRLEELRDVGVFPSTGLWITETGEDGKKVCRFQVRRLLGILLSIALLTFGAPFWYDTLKNLIKLRSMLAQRDDRERGERQSAAAQPATAPARGRPPSPGAKTGAKPAAAGEAQTD